MSRLSTKQRKAARRRRAKYRRVPYFYGVGTITIGGHEFKLYSTFTYTVPRGVPKGAK